MKFKLTALVSAVLACAAQAQTQTEKEPADPPIRQLGVVVIDGSAPTSLPTQVPTTIESISAQQLTRTVNASDSEDALKYFPSLLVRKRYAGDYNHAVLSSRASGTGNSARSLVYADGILLSNLLGNGVGGLTFAPRWGLVTPEEIARVDVMYGPFSAVYAGNSVGAVVDYQTRMPKAFEAQVQAGYDVQPFDLYGHHAVYHSWQSSASLGNRVGDWSWWVNVNHAESEGQPLTFATRLPSNSVAGAAGTPVTGAVAGLNSANQAWWLLGSGTQYDSTQDHAKVKLAYELTPQWRASYLLGFWRNESNGHSQSWLHDANGQSVSSGAINIGGQAFTGLTQAVSGADFAQTREDLLHVMQGASLKSHGLGAFDWELAASRYEYQRDDKRQNSAANTQASIGGPGTLADGSGTGWDTLALKGIWRAGAHQVDFGAQQERYRLRYLTSNISGNYLIDPAGSLASAVQGDTSLQSLYAQDLWTITPAWRAMLGLRAESWHSTDGRTDFSASSSQAFAPRHVQDLSPKAALSWQLQPDTVLKASIGRAVRMPTVNELFGATSTSNSQYINDPNLAPERSWTSEWTAEHDSDMGRLRLTFFTEDTHDALYSQTTFDPMANKNISRVQNIGHIGTKGLETAFGGAVGAFEINGSLSYTDSKILSNSGFVATPGDTLGKRQPNIPRWRATLVGSWRIDAQWSATLAGRYSGTQYRTLNNADVNGFAYQGVSSYATLDMRVLWQISRPWTAAFGIDNLNNDKYWNFHPYPQRSFHLELKYKLGS